MIEPLHIANVGGHPLRFFKTPLDDGRPDLPWHCVDDLHRCLGLNRDARRTFLRKLQNANWKKDVRTVATADGLVTIAPHYMAQGWIDASVEEGITATSVRHDYDHAGVEATKKIPKPPFPSDEFLDWMKAAMNRWERA